MLIYPTILSTAYIVVFLLKTWNMFIIFIIRRLMSITFIFDKCNIQHPDAILKEKFIYYTYNIIIFVICIGENKIFHFPL